MHVRTLTRCARTTMKGSQRPLKRPESTTSKPSPLPKPRPKMPRKDSRLSSSRYEFGVSNMIQSPPPPRPGSCLLEGGRTPASEGERSGCTQDIPNPHLEVESREPVLDAKTDKRQANRDAQTLALAPSNSDLGCGRVPSCALRRSGLMRHGGFSKRIKHGTGQKFTTEKSNRDRPQAQFCYIFPRPSWARNKRKAF